MEIEINQGSGSMTGRKRGRPKIPSNLKLLYGNPGNRPISEDEPKPKPTIPQKPSWLKGKAAREWKIISGKLQELGLLTDIDYAALATYCQCYARYMQAEEFLEKYSHDTAGKFNGFMIKTPSGYLQQLPQVSIAQTYAKLMAVYLGKFGLSPADRAGLNVAKDEKKTGRLSKTLSG
jgi:P27 family predicted phage terminase small subunit